MKLEAAGTNLVVEMEEAPQKESGRFVVCEDKPLYTRGRVVSAGDMADFCYGDMVVFLTEKGGVVGLGFPPSIVIVDGNDVHAVIVDEEDVDAEE